MSDKGTCFFEEAMGKVLLFFVFLSSQIVFYYLLWKK